MVRSIPTFRSCSAYANAAWEPCPLHNGKYVNISIFLPVGDLHMMCSYHCPSSLRSSSDFPCSAVVFPIGVVIIMPQTAAVLNNFSAEPGDSICRFRTTLENKRNGYSVYDLCYCGTLSCWLTQPELEEGEVIHPHPKLGQTCSPKAWYPPQPATPPMIPPASRKRTCSSSPYHLAFTCHEQIVPRSCHASRSSGRDFLAIGRR